MKHVFYANLGAAFFLLAVVGSVDSVAGSNSYRWQNSSGETVFSDQPPPNGEKYDVITIPSRLKPVTSDTGDDVSQKIDSSVSNDSKAVDSSSEANESDSKKNSGLCEQAKMNLVSLEAPRKVNIRNDQGEIRELTPEEREISKQTAKAQIDVYCD